eukprot:Nk52_evm4s268 gene=Nk52_evmTU4s268
MQLERDSNFLGKITESVDELALEIASIESKIKKNHAALEKQCMSLHRSVTKFPGVLESLEGKLDRDEFQTVVNPKRKDCVHSLELASLELVNVLDQTINSNTEKEEAPTKSDTGNNPMNISERGTLEAVSAKGSLGFSLVMLLDRYGKGDPEDEIFEEFVNIISNDCFQIFTGKDNVSYESDLFAEHLMELKSHFISYFKSQLRIQPHPLDLHNLDKRYSILKKLSLLVSPKDHFHAIKSVRRRKLYSIYSAFFDSSGHAVKHMNDFNLNDYRMLLNTFVELVQDDIKIWDHFYSPGDVHGLQAFIKSMYVNVFLDVAHNIDQIFRSVYSLADFPNHGNLVNVETLLAVIHVTILSLQNIDSVVRNSSARKFSRKEKKNDSDDGANNNGKNNSNTKNHSERPSILRTSEAAASFEDDSLLATVLWENVFSPSVGLYQETIIAFLKENKTWAVSQLKELVGPGRMNNCDEVVSMDELMFESFSTIHENDNLSARNSYSFYFSCPADIRERNFVSVILNSGEIKGVDGLDNIPTRHPIIVPHSLADSNYHIYGLIFDLFLELQIYYPLVVNVGTGKAFPAFFGTFKNVFSECMSSVVEVFQHRFAQKKACTFTNEVLIYSLNSLLFLQEYINFMQSTVFSDLQFNDIHEKVPGIVASIQALLIENFNAIVRRSYSMSLAQSFLKVGETEEGKLPDGFIAWNSHILNLTSLLVAKMASLKIVSVIVLSILNESALHFATIFQWSLEKGGVSKDVVLQTMFAFLARAKTILDASCPLEEVGPYFIPDNGGLWKPMLYCQPHNNLITLPDTNINMINRIKNLCSYLFHIAMTISADDVSQEVIKAKENKAKGDNDILSWTEAISFTNNWHLLCRLYFMSQTQPRQLCNAAFINFLCTNNFKCAVELVHSLENPRNTKPARKLINSLVRVLTMSTTFFNSETSKRESLAATSLGSLDMSTSDLPTEFVIALIRQQKSDALLESVHFYKDESSNPLNIEFALLINSAGLVHQDSAHAVEMISRKLNQTNTNFWSYSLLPYFMHSLEYFISKVIREPIQELFSELSEAKLIRIQNEGSVGRKRFEHYARQRCNSYVRKMTEKWLLQDQKPPVIPEGVVPSVSYFEQQLLEYTIFNIMTKIVTHKNSIPTTIRRVIAVLYEHSKKEDDDVKVMDVKLGCNIFNIYFLTILMMYITQPYEYGLMRFKINSEGYSGHLNYIAIGITKIFFPVLGEEELKRLKDCSSFTEYRRSSTSLRKTGGNVEDKASVVLRPPEKQLPSIRVEFASRADRRMSSTGRRQTQINRIMSQIDKKDNYIEHKSDLAVFQCEQLSLFINRVNNSIGERIMYFDKVSQTKPDCHYDEVFAESDIFAAKCQYSTTKALFSIARAFLASKRKASPPMIVNNFGICIKDGVVEDIDSDTLREYLEMCSNKEKLQRVLSPITFTKNSLLSLLKLNSSFKLSEPIVRLMQQYEDLKTTPESVHIEFEASDTEESSDDDSTTDDKELPSHPSVQSLGSNLVMDQASRKSSFRSSSHPSMNMISEAEPPVLLPVSVDVQPSNQEEDVVIEILLPGEMETLEKDTTEDEGQ